MLEFFISHGIIFVYKNEETKFCSRQILFLDSWSMTSKPARIKFRYDFVPACSTLVRNRYIYASLRAKKCLRNLKNPLPIIRLLRGESFALTVIEFSAPGGLYPTLGPQGLGPVGGGMGGGYGPPPDAYGAPDGGYNPPRAYGYQPGHQKAEEEDAFGGCLDKVGLAVGGLIAAGGVAAAMHAINVSVCNIFQNL